MKKLLMGIFGLTLLLPLGVFAEPSGSINSINPGNNSVDATITVEEIDTPIYNVEIYWSHTTYKLEYDEEYYSYHWVIEPQCEGIMLQDADELYESDFYTDNTCQTKIDDIDNEWDNFNSTKIYYRYYDYSGSEFRIYDKSTYGAVVPSLTWNPAEDYEFVNGQFTYNDYHEECYDAQYDDIEMAKIDSSYKIYTDFYCETELTEGLDEITEPWNYRVLRTEYGPVAISVAATEVPSETRNYGENMDYYYINLRLYSDDQTKKIPTSGDTIGTVTISIKAHKEIH